LFFLIDDVFLFSSFNSAGNTCVFCSFRVTVRHSLVDSHDRGTRYDGRDYDRDEVTDDYDGYRDSRSSTRSSSTSNNGGGTSNANDRDNKRKREDRSSPAPRDDRVRSLDSVDNKPPSPKRSKADDINMENDWFWWNVHTNKWVRYSNTTIQTLNRALRDNVTKVRISGLYYINIRTLSETSSANNKYTRNVCYKPRNASPPHAPDDTNALYGPSTVSPPPIPVALAARITLSSYKREPSSSLPQPSTGAGNYITTPEHPPEVSTLSQMLRSSIKQEHQ
jgi:hypothetical protein